MNVTVSANFRFSVVSIQYAPDGELNITLDSDAPSEGTHYRYSAQLGSGQAEEKHSVSCLDDITLYPSPFLVVTDHGYTKHYYAGAERVAARLGAGGLNHDSVCVGNNMDAEQAADSLFLEAWDLANKAKYQRPSTSGIVQIDDSAIGGLEYFDPDDVPVSMQAEVTINPNRIHETIGTLSPTGEPAHNSEPEVYFYHSDLCGSRAQSQARLGYAEMEQSVRGKHLGSASWITDSVGDPIQHLQYLPFGEPFVDQRGVGSTYSERFRFTGKEKDEETGYGYFGARYMDHELMTMWLSVDPIADKYPSISPYAYCAWNPLKLVDPDGNEAIENADWYRDKNGHVCWDANVHSQNDLKYGEEYLGKTIMMTAEGSDNVTYGDQYGYTHESVPLKEVSITASLTDFERTMSNPLVQSIHRSAAEFWGAALDIGIETGAQSFTYCGLGVQTIGFYCLAIPGGEAIGTELFAVGNALSSIGIAFDAINNIREGDLTGLALDAISIAAPRGISKQIDNGVSSGFLSATPKDINLINSYISTRTGYITETLNIGRKK